MYDQILQQLISIDLQSEHLSTSGQVEFSFEDSFRLTDVFFMSSFVVT